MELHRGRLIDHVHIVVADLEASRKFYGAIFEVLGVPASPQAADGTFGYDELYVSTSKMAGGAKPGRVHLAFATRDKSLVDKAYKAGMAAGGRDNGPPGDRPYHPGYYAGFLLDPDGNNIEVVYHGEAKYSAQSIKIEF